ncbi:glycoside hydrolase family 26 protein [Bacteroides sp.]|uniref:glycoside hydrolase family 26 protein n=1 Tax=Bacteroides sp. TaxID=29523 RepID=UPI0026280FBE|nr:glycosyl hydrolase [Bacteroides sp.]
MKAILALIAMSLLLACGKQEEVIATVDKQATTETKQLYNQLQGLQQKGIMFAHQDDLAYGHNWYKEPERSDVKDVSGDYPAMIGWELGHIEIAAPFNLDSVYFSDMRKYIQEGDRRGSINTLSWHGDNIVTGNTAWDCEQNTVVRSILPGGENHKQYLTWLDRLSAFFSSLKNDEGKLIPVIFRMYHEHTGSWFWWGKKQCTSEEYKQLWRMTVERLRDKNNVHNLLYAYSPSDAEVENEADYLDRYPGDEYVDIIGFDCYASGKDSASIENYNNRMALNLDIITKYAAKANKIPCVAETGMESVADSTYFSEILYPLISKHKISYVLLWRNAWEEDKPNHYYVPFKDHPASEDFNKFVNKPDILMCKDIANSKLTNEK